MLGDGRIESLSSPLAGVIVLVVDDHADLRRLLRTWLEDAGALVQEAADGIDALEAVRSQRPDLILCDLQMPGMDGCDFVEVVRTKLHLDIPAIALTGTADPEAHTFESGFVRHLRKPVTREVVVSQAVRTLGGRRGQ